MAILRNIANPQHCIRINRSGGLLIQSDTQARLIVPYRYYKSAEEKEEHKAGGQMIWFEDRQVEYFNEQIIMPAPGWQPKDANNYWVEFIVATGYLSILNDPAFSAEWVSDEQ